MPPSPRSFHLAIDLGGTRIKAGVVADQRLLAHASVQASSRAGLGPNLAILESLVADLCRRAGVDPGQAAGLGVGFPGVVDPQTGRIASTLDKYPDALEVDLAAWAQERWGLALRIENDAHAALLGEVAAGAARGCGDVVMMTLGTGVGTAAMMEGRLLRGHSGRAGCLGGHVTVNLNGPLCVCGNRGCVEAEASTWALPRMIDWADPDADSALRGIGGRPGFHHLFAASAQGDPAARRVRDHCLRVWGAAAVSLVHAYDARLVVIGGGVSRAGEEIIGYIGEYVDRHAWKGTTAVRVVAAQHPDHAALLGVALFPFAEATRS